MRKAKVALGGVPLAANSQTTWRLQTGTQPYKTVFQVHRSDWEKLKGRMGKPLDLVFENGSKKATIREVYILHQMASDSEARVSFVASDARWKWASTFIPRDYNIPKKSGARTVLYEEGLVPVEKITTVDVYNFKRFSLKGDRKWTAKEAVEDCLRALTNDGGPRFFVESWPIKDGGEFTLQNVILRDQGDVALSRLMSFVPGAEVYIDIDGLARVFDGADIKATDRVIQDLGFTTRDGDVAVTIDRHAIRPPRSRIHYTREMECLFEYSDYLGTTQSDPDPDEPYLENVMATVDPETEVTYFDPIAGKRVTGIVPQGTWVNFWDLMAAWEKDRKGDGPIPNIPGSMPWTWETLKRHWVVGLEGHLLPTSQRGSADIDEDGNVDARINAIRQHFRQTFRVNRRYMERIRDIKEFRVGPVDPVTGARANAPVWGQYCVNPSAKGVAVVARRRDPSAAHIWRNFDNIPKGDTPITQAPSGPGMVSFISRDLGIFRVNWTPSPYGTTGAIYPCHVVGLPSKDLSKQDETPMAPGMKVQDGDNHPRLADRMEMRVLLTIVPAAPNNKSQFHVETVEPRDIDPMFRAELGIKSGKGPVLDLLVAPGESTARFAWDNDALAKQTVKQALGLNYDDPALAGLPYPTRELIGFKWMNRANEVEPHAKSFAAESYVNYADAPMGRVATPMLDRPLTLRGNTSSVSISAASAPSGKVAVLHEFPGFQKPVSRFAMMSDDARRMTLGIIPLKEDV